MTNLEKLRELTVEEVAMLFMKTKIRAIEDTLKVFGFTHKASEEVKRDLYEEIKAYLESECIE